MWSVRRASCVVCDALLSGFAECVLVAVGSEDEMEEMSEATKLRGFGSEAMAWKKSVAGCR